MNAVPRVFWKPADRNGPACLSIEVNGLKTYRRIWSPGEEREVSEWGWSLHESAVELKPEVEA